MTGILVTGHGRFASGIVSALELIAGKQENVVVIDFIENQSTEILKENIERSLNLLGDEIIVFCDLAGGSPFKTSVILSRTISNKKIEVVAGVNLGMLLEIVLLRGDTCAEKLAEMALNSGGNALKRFKLKDKEEVEDFDGI
ncbi:PTS galactosamine/N-acetylgalactosamine transporter subunit IIA [Clostridium frigidicarnis]|uniref:PTS system, N-acetylgalactosamine-specific IIA component n=1 Tax=Clostridium frigidicarnis TaxID=84698 RepID=A0A1I0YI87_9CLOT|nr:PTS galactosamine/N-acetylgalactosamine transporter subunit IIA [Clostridium frigidicarnis]SFB12597.1 PTS system, N-acetylgalactosamine-specific IIA component [Clostridium frigidicarnis]